MRIFQQFLLFLLLFFILKCDEKKEKQQNKPLQKKTEKVVKEKIEKAVEKPWDSINYQNSEAFLTEFGKQNPETKVIIKTKFGNIKLRLFEDVPLHRANFIFLTKIKYFNTTEIYRVAKNFVIQGGNSDRVATLKQRRKYGYYLLNPEFKKHRTHKYGALAAARDWDDNPNKVSSPFEFYIVHKRSGAHHLNGEHTIFGEVISGFDTMDKISEVKVGSDEWPIENIPITVEILD